jgi:Spy/CpxP family protein refolding chaperone
MQRSTLVTMRRCTHLLIPALAISISLGAQPALRAKGAPAVANPDTALFFELVNMSASLELALFGVAGITDTQRDQIEALEAGNRESIAMAASPLRGARRVNLGGWPSEQDLHERALNRIAAIRNAGLDSARALLDDAQRPQFDRNRLHLDSAAGLGSLSADDSRWLFYLKPRMGTPSLGPTY